VFNTSDKKSKMIRLMQTMLFIIILNFNSGEHTINCINSVIKQGEKDIASRLIVVDNASTDDSVVIIRKSYPNIKLIVNTRNLGYAAGNNVGIEFAIRHGANFIFISNPDTKIEKGSIDKLLKVLKTNEKIGIVGPKIYSSSGAVWSLGGKIDKKRFTCGLIGFRKKEKKIGKNLIKQVDYISGTAMMFRKEIVDKIGLLSEDYFLYYEDADYCVRAKEAGYGVMIALNSKIIHNWSAVVGKGSSKKKYYMARNHFLFLEKHAPLRIKLREFLRLPWTVYEHASRGDRYSILGIKDYILRRFGKCDYWC
jgi:GT2 family glycosyltransferase